MWALVYGGVPFVVPYLVSRQRRVAEPEPGADPRLRGLRIVSTIAGVPLLIAAAALSGARRARQALAVGPDAAARAGRRGLVRAVRNDAADVCGRAAAAGRTIIPYATLAAWCVLLLALPLLRPDDMSGPGGWIALMLVLLALAAYALRDALPDRARL